MKTSEVRKPFRNLSLAILLVIGLLAVPASAAWGRPIAGTDDRPSLVASVIDFLLGAWARFGGLVEDGGGLSEIPLPDGGAPTGGGSGGTIPPPGGGGGGETTNGGDCSHATDPDGCPG